jgi:hypothetical protein
MILVWESLTGTVQVLSYPSLPPQVLGVPGVGLESGGLVYYNVRYLYCTVAAL